MFNNHATNSHVITLKIVFQAKKKKKINPEQERGFANDTRTQADTGLAMFFLKLSAEAWSRVNVDEALQHSVFRFTK